MYIYLSANNAFFVRQVDNSRMLIGQISLDSKADWETLQNTISDTFKVRKTQSYIYYFTSKYSTAAVVDSLVVSYL